MKKTNRVISLILSICLLLSFVGCSSNGNIQLPSPSADYWQDVPDDKGESSDIWKNGEEPNINITVIGGNKKVDDTDSEIDEGIVDSVYALVNSAVTKDLEGEGFTCGIGVATTVENDNYSGIGIYYSNPEFQIFDSTSGIECVGFIEIVSTNERTCAPDKEDSIIVVNDLDEVENVSNSDAETQKICTYNYENIGSYHFVYKNKYVSYYQESAMRVVYNVLDNDKKNYDLTLGDLYDYDNKCYIYDESIYGEYKTHSGEVLLGKENYELLEEDLKKQVEEQKKAGYNVDEYEIVYISPEAIQAYVDSEEEATFFGYNVEILTEAFGLGTALVYTGDGFVASEVIKVDDDSYNWKSFLIKCGIGCGIILVGAILTPVTGGASFGCALLTISKVAVSYALSSAIGTLAIETVTGLVHGKNIADSLQNATYKGLDAFANGFMIGAAIGSVGVVTGVIKPTACFVEGTSIAITNHIYKYIENISVGDYVLSYNETNKQVSQQKVSEVFRKDVYQIVELVIEDETIQTTYDHPFYSPVYKCWIGAGSLKEGDFVLSSDELLKTVKRKTVRNYENPVTVYNFTVENNHTYFVGENEVLVHNECTTLQSKRNKAVSEAWKKEKQAVMDHTSKYNWTSAQKADLLKTGKIKGQAGHHIKPVNELIGTAHEHLISDPNNIVFLSDDVHKWVHIVGDSFEKTAPRVVRVMPWTADVIAKLALIV